MANRTDALLSGVGEFGEVYNTHIEALNNLGQSPNDISALNGLLNDPNWTPEQKMACWAVIAAKLNEGLVATGQLWSVSAAGRLTYNFICEDSQRQLLRDLMS